MFHKWLYVRFIGPVPKGYELHHICWMQNCSKIFEHLKLVTIREHKDIHMKNRKCDICGGKLGHYNPNSSQRVCENHKEHNFESRQRFNFNHPNYDHERYEENKLTICANARKDYEENKPAISARRKELYALKKKKQQLLDSNTIKQ